MVTIRDWLRQLAARFFDQGLSWGARTSSYGNEIAAELAARRRVVLIELTDDLGLHRSVAGGCLVIVDHHGANAGAKAPTSLRQVFDLTCGRGEEWSRWFALVDANDRGHVRAMKAIGASLDELHRVRAADRAAQGITEAQEQAGREAARHAESMCGGAWTFVRSPHGRTAAVTDFLHEALGGPGFENLLILWPDGQQFFGAGRIVSELASQFPGGYFGGEMPERGFWGHPQKLDENNVRDAVDRAVLACQRSN